MMPLLRPQSLTRLRAVTTRARSEQCSLFRATSTAQPGGGVTLTWTLLAANVTCRREQQGDPPYVFDAGRFTETVPVRIFVPAGQDVRGNDRILHADGNLYQVLGTPGAETDAPWQWADCAWLRAGAVVPAGLGPRGWQRASEQAVNAPLPPDAPLPGTGSVVVDPVQAAEAAADAAPPAPAEHTRMVAAEQRRGRH